MWGALGMQWRVHRAINYNGSKGCRQKGSLRVVRHRGQRSPRRSRRAAHSGALEHCQTGLDKRGSNKMPVNLTPKSNSAAPTQLIISVINHTIIITTSIIIMMLIIIIIRVIIIIMSIIIITIIVMLIMTINVYVYVCMCVYVCVCVCMCVCVCVYVCMCVHIYPPTTATGLSVLKASAPATKEAARSCQMARGKRSYPDVRGFCGHVFGTSLHSTSRPRIGS